MKKLKIFCAMLLILLALFSCLAVKAESVPSPTIRSLYRVESDVMRLSDAPLRITILDIAVVDIDGQAIQGMKEITARVQFPVLPDEGIEGVVLFDGYHLAQSTYTRDGDWLVISFDPESLRPFDGTVGLFLVLIGSTE